MFYDIRLANEDSSVYVLVKADSVNEAIQKTEVEYPGRKVTRIFEATYDNVIA
jgi:hypothetical protein